MNPFTIYTSGRSIFYTVLSLSIVLSASPAMAGKSKSPKKCISIRKALKLGLVGLMTGGTVPTTQADGWYAGTTLPCTSYNLWTDPITGITSVVCDLYGGTDHGVTCTSHTLLTDGTFLSEGCDSIFTIDENSVRDCTTIGDDVIDGYPGVFCDDYGFDPDAPYCTSDSLVEVGGITNPTCDTLYCPTCLYYSVSSNYGRGGSCFPEQAFVQVKNQEGTISRISMRDIRLGMTLLAGYSRNGSEIYSTVKSVPHRNPNQTENYLEIKYLNGTHTGSFLVSADHHIYVASHGEERFDTKTSLTKFANQIKNGDHLWSDAGQQVEVTSIASAGTRLGVYAPRTETGTLVVFDSREATLPVVASSYSTVNKPLLAHLSFNAYESVFPPKQIEDPTINGDGPLTRNLVSMVRQALPQYLRGVDHRPQPSHRKSREGRHRDRSLDQELTPGAVPASQFNRTLESLRGTSSK